MKKIVIATDSYKDCMSGLDVASNIEIGFKKEFPNCEFVKLAMADGGEGTVNSLVLSTSGYKQAVWVLDPLGREVESFLGFNQDKTVAFIEMAAASGLELLSYEERNPQLTNTYGTGQLIKSALDSGAKHIIIGIGGSATNDCGIGMAACLGAKFYDQNNQIVNPIGANLKSICKIDMKDFDKRIYDVKLEVACDVENQMYGENGASYVFGKQKGATSEMIVELEAGVKHFATVINEHFNRNPQDLVGGGAAGGLGVGLNFFCRGNLRSGVEIVTDFLELDKHVRNADLVITGEGRIDSQSINGKAPIGVALVAKTHNVKCIAICGAVEPDAEASYDFGMSGIFSIVQKAGSLDEAFKNTASNLQITARSIARLLN